MSDTVKGQAIRTAVALIRCARAGSLATAADGQPFASLVTPTTAPDRSLLMLLSGLSPHTSHLRAEPRCSIMLLGTPTGPNPQTTPRITLIGRAAPEPEPKLKARWVALHPYAAFYADLGDFHLWRFQADDGQFVGGFASAHRFSAPDLAPDHEAVAAISTSEGRILAHCNEDHLDAMDAIASSHGGVGDGWRMVSCDTDGFALARDEDVLRIAWSAPVSGPDQVRAELVRFAGAARNPVAPASGPLV